MTWNGKHIAVLAAAWLSFGSVPADTVLQRAAEGIEQHRKSDVRIIVRHWDGSPASGVVVNVVQTAHDFPFGNIFRPRHYDDERYRARFLELFNFVELLEFNWGQYEPDEGTPLLHQRLKFMREWCVPNGLERFYAHMLVWTVQYGEYPKTVLPEWLFKYDRGRQLHLLRQRIQREVRAYREFDITWDVVNEPTHTRTWGDWDKRGYIDEPLTAQMPYVSNALQWAHEADPAGKFIINDYAVIVEGKYQERYVELLDSLRQRGAPLHGLGIQAHEPSKGAYWLSPSEIWNAYERFAVFGPIHITEHFYVSDATRQIRGSHRQGNWNPQRQAEAIEEFYRVSFGHPAVASIVYFGMSDNDVWRPGLGLLDENFEPKPAWHALRQLIREEWMTRHEGLTDESGELRLRGFHGKYRVRVGSTESGSEVQTHLRKSSEANEWEIELQ